jgi:antirestriction protein ArdC
MNRNDIYNRINNQILSKLEDGVIPWRKSWKEGVPTNLISKKAYNGINFMSLCLNDFSSPYYVTFLQCKQKDGSIIRGEKSSLIVYYKLVQLEDRENHISGARKTMPFLRYSNVFNLTQTTLELPVDKKPKIVECEQILAQMKDKPLIRHNIRRAFYSPSEDYISLPRMEDFESESEFWSTLYHEIIHATGHPKRLNRSSICEKDSDTYCYEELVAEIGASYLAALSGISQSVVENQAAYINGYLNLSKVKENLFPMAAKDAARAVDFVLSTPK